MFSWIEEPRDIVFEKMYDINSTPEKQTEIMIPIFF